jgi:hypothetical protein
MSVILFNSRDKVFQDLADGYEGLKYLRGYNTQEQNDTFYNSLRRLYFANVATYLCQYHDDTPLSESELSTLDTFQRLQGKDRGGSEIEKLNKFLYAWSLLDYNLVTNDGEKYKAEKAYACITDLAIYFSKEVAENLAPIAWIA